VAALRQAILHDFAGRIAVVSSFGAESALLLAMVADIDRRVPVLFLDTGQHFPETLGYAAALAGRLGLADLRHVRPDAVALGRADPLGTLHRFIPDDCCELRKVAPLARALAPFGAWITGRKRFQSADRAALPIIEQEGGADGGHTKLNPLADWSAAEIAAELRRRGLPPHPLVARGYASIGCAPCTHPVAPGEDPRSGRWAGTAKTECGIHLRAGAPAGPAAGAACTGSPGF
jgi:phosphoadenosine phosphosulfate reductase